MGGAGYINTLLPLFAWIALGANALGWLSHRQWHRSVAGMVGPAMVLLSLYPWFQYGWSTWTLYGGLALMLIVAVWDLVSPAHRRCGPESCEVPQAKRNTAEIVDRARPEIRNQEEVNQWSPWSWKSAA